MALVTGALAAWALVLDNVVQASAAALAGAVVLLHVFWCQIFQLNGSSLGAILQRASFNGLVHRGVDVGFLTVLARVFGSA